MNHYRERGAFCLVGFVVFAVGLLPCYVSAQMDTSQHLDVRSLLAPKDMKVDAKSAVLMDATTGQILVEYNKNYKIPPASFAKVLTLYVVFDTIKHGKLKLDDKVYISKKAWKTGGSKMFIEVNSKVPVRELIKGIAVVSGNDACVALAEHIYESTDTFVKIMNETAKKIGMKNSHFSSPHGLPNKQQYTTAYDMAVLARDYISRFPEALRFHAMQEYTYGGIKQYNRNGLLRKDPSVDGLKTGYIAKAGYHLLATAKRGGRRLIAVVMGAKSPAIREREARKLLNYGYHRFELLRMFRKGQILAEVPVWKGVKNSVALVATDSGVLTVPVEYKERVHEENVTPEEVVAPVRQGQVLGKAFIKIDTEIVKRIPLVAQQEIRQAGFVKLISHSVYRLSKNHVGILLILVVVLIGGVRGYVVLTTRKRKSRRSGLRF